MKGIPSIGFSLCDFDADADFSPTVPYVRGIVARVLKTGLPAGMSECKLSRPSDRVTVDEGMQDGPWDVVQRVVCSRPSSGWKIFWLTGEYTKQEAGVRYGCVAGARLWQQTPVTVDVTAYRAGWTQDGSFMKYYLIVGEASGDLHASHLMKELKARDAEADFRFLGGDLMKAQGGTLVRHYKELAYMGFIPVLLHLRTILHNMKACKRDVLEWNPDVLILVDYPGFNLSVAEFVHAHSPIPVYYYISPKIWAWKEYRIKNIKRDVDELFSILPFEVDFFEGKHHYPIHYVGNPTLDEVEAYKRENEKDFGRFAEDNGLEGKPVLALLAGSRKQEIKDNLPMMVEAASVYEGQYELVLAAAPNIDPEFYGKVLRGSRVKILYGQTYRILHHACAALVTSGTATLETALFRVPQVVCYYTACGKLVSFLRRHILKVRYISLVNLVAGREVVRELVADGMSVGNIREELSRILPGGNGRTAMLQGYEEMAVKLGDTGAPAKAASLMLRLLERGVGRRATSDSCR